MVNLIYEMWTKFGWTRSKSVVAGRKQIWKLKLATMRGNHFKFVGTDL